MRSKRQRLRHQWLSSPENDSFYGEKSGQGRARTADTGLFRAVLYQLSYLTEVLRGCHCNQYKNKSETPSPINSTNGDRRV